MSLFVFTKTETGRQNRFCLRGGIQRKEVGGRIWWRYSVRMYVNRKMRPVETIPEMVGERIKENDGDVEFNYDIL
jgi:hypothetical protein